MTLKTSVQKTRSDPLCVRIPHAPPASWLGDGRYRDDGARDRGGDDPLQRRLERTGQAAAVAGRRSPGPRYRNPAGQHASSAAHRHERHVSGLARVRQYRGGDCRLVTANDDGLGRRRVGTPSIADRDHDRQRISADARDTARRHALSRHGRGRVQRRRHFLRHVAAGIRRTIGCRGPHDRARRPSGTRSWR